MLEIESPEKWQVLGHDFKCPNEWAPFVGMVQITYKYL